MILDATSPVFATPSNQLLLHAHGRDINALREKWLDEAAEAAVEGNPYRAGYIEWITGRLLG